MIIHRFKIIFLLLLSFIITSHTFADSASEGVANHKAWSFLTPGLIPVQNGGRIKPLDSFAREAVLFTTGSRSYHGWNSVDLIFSWIAFPQYWETQPFIRVDRSDVRRQLGLDENRNFYTPQELFRNPILAQYAAEIGNVPSGSQPPGAPRSSPRDQELKAVLERVGTFHNLVTGQGWLLIPKPAPAAWGSLVDHDSGDGELIRNQFIETLKAYQSGNETQFGRSSNLLKAAIEGEIPGYREHFKKEVAAESLYNRLRPFLVAWILYFVAAVVWTIGQFVQNEKWLKNVKRLGLFVIMAACASHVLGFGLRCYVAGRPPVTNMYESVIWVSLGTVLFAAF